MQQISPATGRPANTNFTMLNTHSSRFNKLSEECVSHSRLRGTDLMLGGEEVKDACVRTFDVLSSRHAHDVTGVKP